MTMTWLQEIEARSRAEAAERKAADERAARLKLRMKYLMAGAAARALVKAGCGNLAVALTWVEEAVEEVALEEGLQEHVHAEHPVQVRYTGRKRIRRHFLYPRTLAGRMGVLWQGRAVLWRPSNRGTRGRRHIECQVLDDGVMCGYPAPSPEDLRRHKRRVHAAA
jgi:hypothetical protein